MERHASGLDLLAPILLPALPRFKSHARRHWLALWALQNPATYPAADFETAYRHVLLYSEHTWGAWCLTTLRGELAAPR
jgi:hypothetical protein